jgi:hypothetical protein
MVTQVISQRDNSLAVIVLGHISALPKLSSIGDTQARRFGSSPYT